MSRRRKNAHPHSDCAGEIWTRPQRHHRKFQRAEKSSGKKGHTFVSDSDTEILAHLIEEHLKKKSFEKAALAALNEVRGTYGIAMQYKGEPDKLIAARMGSPIVLGLGQGERFIASDPSPILPHTKSVVFLEDGDVAVLTPKSHKIVRLDSTRVKRKTSTIDWSTEEAQKSGFEHFMLKEIMEAPEVVENTLRGRLIRKRLGEARRARERREGAEKIERIIITACGTAYYGGVVGEYMLEEFAGIPVEVELASEFRYRSPVLNQRPRSSPSRNRARPRIRSKLSARGKKKGALTLGIVNAVGSTIARETDAGVYNHAGPEISVASTKALVSQLTALVLLTLFLGRQRKMSAAVGRKIAAELKRIPQKAQRILDARGAIEKVAKKYSKNRDFLFIGRKYNYPIAFEGAIKLKEISYIHAEGYGAGEMKHGPIAMIDEHFPTVALATKDSVYEKMLSNIRQLKARKGPVIAIATEGGYGDRGNSPTTLSMCRKHSNC